MINAVGVKNFRSIKDITINEGYIDLKPFTVLLGKNSSGKSTFLRLFPLLKQSVSGRTRGALALYGDEVDFGDFDTLVSCDSDNQHDDFLELRFKGYFDAKKQNKSRASSAFTDVESFDYTALFIIKNNPSSDDLFISNARLLFLDNEIAFSINEKNEVTQFTINGDSIYQDKLDDKHVQYLPNHPGFPVFNIQNNLIEEFDPFRKFFYHQILSKGYSLNLDFIQLNLRTIKSKENLKDSLREFLRNNNNVVDSLKNIDDFIQSNVSNMYAILTSQELFQEFYNNYLFLNFNFIYNLITSDLTEDFLISTYSKPLRANADRYYRGRTLYINEINSDGSNLVEYFSNLQSTRQKSFENWMKENFHFYYTVEKSKGYKSIMIHEANVKHNVTDMGFGFSQILPIITQLWVLSENTDNQARRIIYSIEQPELHLHPALQNKLIKSLVKIAAVGKKKNLNISFIIETHSETMVNKLGRLVEEEQIGTDDIQVLIFSKDNSDHFSNIETSTFNENGELKNWPVGFFGDDE